MVEPQNLETVSEAVQLFWTGGWDSTFRLLQLVIFNRRRVQPHYLIDTERKSTMAELHAMINIKRQVFSRFPDAEERIYQTELMNKDDLPPDPIITQSFLQLRQSYHIGSQYEWLAGYCKAKGLNDVELGATRGGYTIKVISSQLEYFSEGEEKYCKINSHFKDSNEYNLFGWYRFPMIFYTKLDMKEMAWKESLQDIMMLTWFCHHPGPNLTPCGLCIPCSMAIQEGFAWRIPFLNRVKHFLFSNIRKAVRKDN